MDRATRNYRKSLPQNIRGALPQTDERPDWMITLSNLPWGRIAKIAGLAVILGAALVISKCDVEKKNIAIERFYQKHGMHR